MNKQIFTVICIFTSILGLIIMFLASKMSEPEIVKISQINLNKNYILFNATITGIQFKPGIIILNLKDDTGNIQAIIYESQTNLKPGYEIRIMGKPQKYKEKIQVRVLDLVVLQVS